MDSKLHFVPHKVFCLFVCFLQDIRVSYNQIEPVIVIKGRPQFGASSDHGRVFIPQTMVELGEQIKGSDTTEKGTDGTKDTHQEAGVDNEDRRYAASKLEKEKAGLAALQQNTPNYTQDPHQPSVVVPAQGDWATQQHLGIGSAVVISNSNPPMYGTIRWIGTIPQVNGYVAGVELVSYDDLAVCNYLFTHRHFVIAKSH